MFISDIRTYFRLVPLYVHIPLCVLSNSRFYFRPKDQIHCIALWVSCLTNLESTLLTLLYLELRYVPNNLRLSIKIFINQAEVLVLKGIFAEEGAR